MEHNLERSYVTNMSETTSFQIEILKQLKSEWVTKIQIGQETLKELRDQMHIVVHQVQQFGLVPGQIPVEWSEPETKKFRPKVIMEEILFANMVLAYIDLKLEECQLRSQRKDPKVLAKMYQRMDHARLTLYAISSEQADLLLKRIKSAIAAFVQVMDHYDNSNSTYHKVHFRILWMTMNQFQTWSSSLKKRNLVAKKRVHVKRRSLSQA